MKRATVASALSKSTVKDDTSSSIPKEAVEQTDIMKHLKKYHATLMISSTMFKSFHYCLVGKGFFTLHPTLGEYWEELDDIIDDVAELIVTLEGVPVLTMKDAIELSMLAEYPFSGTIDCREAMINVEIALGSLAELSKNIATAFDELDDIGSSGLLGDQYNYYTKKRWMVRAYLRG